jgi:hypothetical protein
MLAVTAACLALLMAVCAGAAIALRTGHMPAGDWRIETGAFQFLLVHNGPTVICQQRSLRDGCVRQVMRHEFYIHYITPTNDRQLLWFRTPDP